MNQESRLVGWQRKLLLLILAYEGIGAMLGGFLLILSPDGHLMRMTVSIMNGVFPDFFIPGLILMALGLLNSVAYITVFVKSNIDWVVSGAALIGLLIWFSTEIVILQGVHWLHFMWGAPVIIGIFLATLLVPWNQRKISLN